MKQIICLLFVCVMHQYACAQDIHFSQFYEMPLLRNPALSGIFTGNVRAQTIYRNQWQKVTVPYRTMALGVEYKVKGYCIDDDLSVIAGLQVLRDEAGTSKYTRTQVAGTATIRKKITDNLHFSGGVIAGDVINSYDRSDLSWSDQYIDDQYSPDNPTQQPFIAMRRNYFDIGAGVLLSSGTQEGVQWYAGGALYHILPPKMGFDNSDHAAKLPGRVTLNAGAGFNFNSDTPDKIVFYGDYIFQGKQQEILLGAYCTFYTAQALEDADDEGVDVSFGAFYRWNDAVIPTFKLNWNRVTVGVSYDVNISGLTLGSHARGGAECMLKYRGILESKRGTCSAKGCHFN